MAVLGYFACVVILTSCSSSKLERDDYISWIEDCNNGLHVRKDVGDYIFDLQYEPGDYVYLKNREKGVVPDTSLSSNTKSDFQYYLLSISAAKGKEDFINFGISSSEEKQRKLYYFSYQFEQDIFLEENGEKYPCLLFHFERPVDLKNERTFLLGFRNPRVDSKEAKIVIQSEWFGSLPISMKVSKDKIPALEI